MKFINKLIKGYNMDNFKFKAYIKPIDKIVDVKIINYENRIIYAYGESFTETEWLIEDIVLLPSTGVMDNKGKETYYSDIYRRWWYPDYTDYIIEYEGGGFFLGDDLLIDVNWDDYEYIGNKYEKINS